LCTGEGLKRGRGSNPEPEDGGLLKRVTRKLNLNVASSPSQFEGNAGYHYICDLDHLIYADFASVISQQPGKAKDDASPRPLAQGIGLDSQSQDLFVQPH